MYKRATKHTKSHSSVTMFLTKSCLVA